MTEPGDNAHYDGAIARIHGRAAGRRGQSRRAVDRPSDPQGPLPGRDAGRHGCPTLLAGTFFRRSRVGRYVHSYNEDGTVAAAMQETAARPVRARLRIGRRIGRRDRPAAAAPEAERARCRGRSVQVLRRRQFPLGATSRARVADHLDRIREYEQRAWHERAPGPPESPPPSKLLHGGEAIPAARASTSLSTELTAEWRLMADLYALAIQTDRVRFGSDHLPGRRRADSA